MKSFIEITLIVESEQLREILIAELSDLNFSGFEEDDKILKAFIDEVNWQEEELRELLDKYHLTYSKSAIENKNWNEMWESSFSPVRVGNFCLIRADFHPSSTGVEHEVIITPKMSFGTGHHATTYIMVQQMQHIDFKRKRVADFGTGTGILAILAEKLGSTSILAVDNDDWSIENARENFNRNHCKGIFLQKADTFSAASDFDVILANINRNIILQNFDGLVFGLGKGGILLLSGILKKDEQEIIVVAARHNLAHINTVERGEWISILLKLL
jgi:ribosomal protein L11 methyltransferase